MSGLRGALASVVGALLVVTGSARALTPEDKCEAVKNQEAGKYAFCRAKAEAKAIKRGLPPNYAKCDAKLLDKWGKAEQRAIDAGAACIDSVTGTAIQSFATAHTDAVAAALAGGALPVCGLVPGSDPILSATGQTTAHGVGSDGAVQAGRALSYTDNGDGTITDNNTGLIWEKKDDADGIHDQDNGYSWSTGTDDMDGTIVTIFLAALNDVGGGGANCFAGHCDWRVPNARELESIRDLEAFSPSVDAAFYQVGTCSGCTDVTLPSCSCTAGANYWSSTTVASNPGAAWYVNFNDGEVYSDSKSGDLQVRAVRGGL